MDCYQHHCSNLVSNLFYMILVEDFLLCLKYIIKIK
jgi:hypothetical protein